MLVLELRDKRGPITWQERDWNPMRAGDCVRLELGLRHDFCSFPRGDHASELTPCEVSLQK